MDRLFPISPSQEAQPTRGVEQPGLADRWRQWISKPQNSAFLMQTGIALTQPAAGGFLANATRAVGEGMEARDRVTQGEIAQATAAQDRKLKQSAANLDAEQLGVQKERLELDKKNSAAERGAKRITSLSSLIRAGKQGRTGKSLDERWLDTYARLRENSLDSAEAWTPERIDAERQAFLEAARSAERIPAVGETSQAAQSAAIDGKPSGVPENTVITNGTVDYISKGGKWVRM